MAALQVRDFPADLYEKLRQRAEQEHRSISQQTIVAIQEHLLGPNGNNGCGVTKPVEVESRVEKRRRLFAEIAALPKFNIPEGFPTPEEIIREIRDSR
jgi:hypothetical protein